MNTTNNIAVFAYNGNENKYKAIFCIRKQKTNLFLVTIMKRRSGEKNQRTEQMNSEITWSMKNVMKANNRFL